VPEALGFGGNIFEDELKAVVDNLSHRGSLATDKP
jgi:hypothetical protein